MDEFVVSAIGHVRGGRSEVKDDEWGAVAARVELDPEVVEPTATLGLEEFSHVEVVYIFDQLDPTHVQTGARRPRGNPAWPEVGILAQRAKYRPNRIGVTTCELLGVDGLTIDVAGLDAVDGTPVLDVKPFMTGFAPRTAVVEPTWAAELMSNYW